MIVDESIKDLFIAYNYQDISSRKMFEKMNNFTFSFSNSSVISRKIVDLRNCQKMFFVVYKFVYMFCDTFS